MMTVSVFSHETLKGLFGGAKSTLLLGSNADALAAVVQAECNGGTVHLSWDQSRAYDRVVVSDPIPHSGKAEEVLCRALQHASAEGGLVAFFPSRCDGHEAFCRTGVEIVLSRIGLEIDRANELGSEGDASQTAGWIALAMCRPERLSPFGEARRRRREEAQALNASGEQLFLRGHFPAAIAAFVEAVAVCNDDPVFLNNLGTVLDIAGRPEDAWRRIREALHLDPNLASARYNLRSLAIKLDREQEADWLLRLYGTDAVEA